jgi:hypothetical protein
MKKLVDEEIKNINWNNKKFNNSFIHFLILLGIEVKKYFFLFIFVINI